MFDQKVTLNNYSFWNHTSDFNLYSNNLHLKFKNVKSIKSIKSISQLIVAINWIWNEIHLYFQILDGSNLFAFENMIIFWHLWIN